MHYALSRIVQFMAMCFFFVLMNCGGGPPQNQGGQGGQMATTDTSTLTDTGDHGGGGSGGQGTGGQGTGGNTCQYYDLLAFVKDAAPDGPILPLPGEENKGAGASRLGPWETQRTFQGVRLGNPESQSPDKSFDVWTQFSHDPGTHMPTYVKMTYVSSEAFDSFYIHTFALPAPLTVPAGHSVFVTAPITEYFPYAMHGNPACYEEDRTWWYGRPIDANGTPTWATLLSPKDPSVNSYMIDFTFGVSEELP